MEKKNLYILVGIVVLIIFGSGMITQKNTNLFSITSSGTCEYYFTNHGMPFPPTLPYNWAYTSTQYRCITSYATSGSGCVINYNSGVCTTTPLPSPSPPTITCNTAADTNCDGKVDRTELGVTINQWIAGSVTRTTLGQVIQSWIGG